ncbi:S5A-REDUCTASE domain-containing protein [Mycena sanguinolenta]|uniref:S5A-REDUCTASE domain-containing protein n=1 Tax=Mycena sanguinolenta TaxID=230812 RepID=A0A8H7D9X4_9AGAR|nr:S5A-REDUCTASE domain-containing protein [Mycena sanguinolenta]
MFGFPPAQVQLLYDGARKWFTLVSLAAMPVVGSIDVPFGRHTREMKNSIFFVDGIKSWILMELVSPACFLYAFLKAPLSPGTGTRSLTLGSPQSLLVGAYLIHYLNRALLSPLRTPSRSKSHIIIPFCATVFNLFNGSLLGAFLSSPAAPQPSAYTLPSFWIGLAMWAAGFAGNIAHDEILLNIRRRANSKGKAKDSESRSKDGHYAIPHGLLYRYITYPNYFCEWIEWLGFAIAADPRMLQAITSGNVSLPSWSTMTYGPYSAFLPLMSPPWIFLATEIVLMLPQAYRGQRWYLKTFGDRYPKERKIIIPFIL